MFYKFKHIFLALTLTLVSGSLFCLAQELVIVGGGIAAGMEAYFAHLDARKFNTPLRITIYEKNKSFAENTISNIVPSLTCDEIIAVVPRGPALVENWKFRLTRLVVYE